MRENKTPVSWMIGNQMTDRVMREVESEVYLAECGLTVRRERGDTPSGNPVSGRWVLRDAHGTWIDFDQYRHDLFERNELKTAY